MRAFAACALAALILAGCSPSTRTGYESPTGSAYTLAIVSGDGQAGTAVIQPVTVTVGPASSSSQATTPAPTAVALPRPLVVEVRNARGELVDGVLVVFEDPTPGTGVVGLGTMTSGYALKTATFAFPPTHGQAAVSAEPYRIGTFPVRCHVDASAGTSNTVVFQVTGT